MSWYQLDPFTCIKPSTAGAMGGVFFMTVGETMHVLKAAGDSLSGILFGEWAMSKISGGVAPDSRPIDRDEQSEGKKGEWQKIMRKIEVATKAAQVQNEQAKLTLANAKGTEGEKQAHEAAKITEDNFTRYNQKYQNFKSSRYIVLQKNLAAGGGAPLLKSMLHKTDIKEGGTGETFNNLMTDLMFWSRAGQVYAGDAFIGNADRFEMFNMDNAFKMANNMIGLVDTEAIYQQFGANSSEAKQDAEEWRKQVLGARGNENALATEGVGSPASSTINVMKNFDAFFNTFVKDGIKKRYVKAFYNPENGTEDEKQRYERFNKIDWDAVRNSMKKGFERGMENITKLLDRNGEQYKAMKEEFKGLSQQFNGGLNMDINALKMRGTYITGSLQGKGQEELDIESQKYAHEKKDYQAPLVKALKVQPILGDVPDNPEMGMMQKLGRKASQFVNGESDSDMALENTKNLLRERKLNSEDMREAIENALNQGKISREDWRNNKNQRVKKVKFELNFYRIIEAMETRSQTLTEEAMKVPSLKTSQARFFMQMMSPLTAMVGQFDSIVGRCMKKFPKKEKVHTTMLKENFTKLHAGSEMLRKVVLGPSFKKNVQTTQNRGKRNK